MKKIFFFASVVSLMSACSDSGDKALEDAMGNDSTMAKSEISAELISEIIKSIPSPVEMSSLIREIEPKYQNELLNPSKNVDNYTTNYQKAINIGIYGTDLGYINLYDEKQDAIIYLNSMTHLAEDLKIGQFFDYSTISRLASNSKNLDSLLYITTNNYDKMNTYLQDQNRGNISLLMLTGGWIEALYIAGSVADKNHHPALYQRIGEQKIVLDQIMILLDFYKSDAKIAELTEKLKSLKVLYDKVQIVYEYHEPTIEVVNGIKMVTDNSKSIIKISKEEVAQLFTIVSNIRTELIK